MALWRLATMSILYVVGRSFLFVFKPFFVFFYMKVI